MAKFQTWATEATDEEAVDAHGRDFLSTYIVNYGTRTYCRASAPRHYFAHSSISLEPQLMGLAYVDLDPKSVDAPRKKPQERHHLRSLAE